MRRLIAFMTTALLTLAMLSGVAQAGSHGHGGGDDVPEHPHAMLQNFELENGMPTFDRCIDLANNRELPLTAHHHSLHTGTAGFGNPEVGITRAGHAVVPLSPFPVPPFSFYEDCDDIEKFLAG